MIPPGQPAGRWSHGVGILESCSILCTAAFSALPAGPLCHSGAGAYTII